MTALERLRALRISEKHPTEALTELPEAPFVSFGSDHVGGISENATADPASNVVGDRHPAPLIGPRWLASVAAHLDITPAALLAAGMILPDEVPHYRDRDPEAFAAAIRITHPGRFPERASDDRRRCRTCLHLSGYLCRVRRLFVMDDLPRRCFDYRPKAGDPDQRTGRERWPELLDDPHSGQTAAQSEREHDGRTRD